MQKFALIVAGGTGKRMGSGIPKQFLELDGKPVLMHTIERFTSFDESVRIILVIPENQFGFWSELQKKYSFTVPHILARGGPHRFFSVKNGMDVIKDDGLVAIHDGVRPLVSKETIKRCFDAAEEYGNAVPGVNPSDSLRMITKQGSKPVSRDKFILIQTPQVFKTGLIKKAYLQDYRDEFTDDATVLESAGEVIHMVDGNRENIKITNPEDLLIAATLLQIVT